MLQVILACYTEFEERVGLMSESGSGSTAYDIVKRYTEVKIGKFTGFYYAASMSAQTVTPILLGFVLKAAMAWRALPVYACILFIASCAVFTALVKNIKAKKLENVRGLEALDGD